MIDAFDFDPSVFSKTPPVLTKEQNTENAAYFKAINDRIVKESVLEEFMFVNRVNQPTNLHCYAEYKFVRKDENGEETWEIVSKESFSQVGTHQVSVTVKPEQIKNLQTQWNIDVLNIVENVVFHEASMTLCKLGIKSIKQLADISYKKTYNNYDKCADFVMNLFKKEYKKKIHFEDAESLLSYITKESNKINKESRNGPAKFAICNPKIGTYLQQLNAYTYASINKINYSGMPYPIGNIAGITIYVDPYMSWDDTTVYLGNVSKIATTGSELVFYDGGTSIVPPKYTLKIRCAAINKGTNPEHNYRKIICKIKQSL
jgi:hypothetical protein